MTTVVPSPSAASRSRPRIPAAAAAPSAPVGSSAKTTSGPVTSARATATRRCRPPESRPGRCPACPPRPTRASTSAVRRRSAHRPASRSDRATFSSTVSDGSRLNAWKTKPRRSRRSAVSRSARIRVTSVPPMRTVPPVGRSRPAAHRRRVDFPEPAGPVTAVKPPCGRSRSMPRRACTAPAPPPYRRRTPRSSTAQVPPFCRRPSRPSSRCPIVPPLVSYVRSPCDRTERG